MLKEPKLCLFPFNLDEKNMEYYETQIALTEDDCRNIFQNTMGQSQNPSWFEARKVCLTASKAQRILRVRSTSTRLKYFFENAVQGASLHYGQEKEQTAKERYMELTQCTVINSGLVVKAEQPWLAASPDGLILKDGKVVVLEIKCPFKCRTRQ